MAGLAGIHYTGILPLLSLLLIAYAGQELAGGRDARRLLKLAFSLVVVGWFVYWIPFITLDFSLFEAYWNTSPGLPLWMRIAASWAGGGGSLFLFAFIASLSSLYLLRETETSRSLQAGLAATVAIGLIAAFFNDAFKLLSPVPASGAGLNPLLKSPWLYPHPLTTFTGYALLATASIPILLGAEGGVRRRAYTIYMLGWAFLTVGILLGGFWSYETFGWGGYWAWDPVETSELMVWLAATLLPHFAPITPSFRASLAGFTAATVFLAMFVTRTGLSPLHSFAGKNIGSLALFLVALAYLASALAKAYHGLERGLSELARSIRSLDTYRTGLAVAGISLAGMALIVFATLFAPSLLIVMGKSVSVPQMDSGIRYFHPLLYPLLIIALAAIPAVFLGDRIGWRGYAALTATTLTVSTILAAAAARNTMVFSPLSSRATNIMIGFGLPLAVVAASSAAAHLALRLASLRKLASILASRTTVLSLLHLGFALTVVGILLSGPYAYNEGYMEKFYLKPGQTIVLPHGYKLTLEGFNYSISSSKVDIYTGYVGRAASYYYGHIALTALANDLGRALREYFSISRELASNTTTQCLVELAALSYGGMQPKVLTRSVEGNATIHVVDFEANKTIVIAGGERVKMSFSGGALTAFPSTASNNIVLHVALRLFNFTLETGRSLSGLLPEGIGVHRILDVRFAKPVKIEAELGGRNVSILVREALIAALPSPAAASPESVLLRVNGSKVTGTLVLVDVPNGTVVCSGSAINLPARLSEGVIIYTAFKHNKFYRDVLRKISEAGLLGFIANNTALRQLTTNPACEASLEAMHSLECMAYVKAPQLVPETAKLNLRFKVTSPNGGEDVFDVSIRFEAYGEIQGIHGLVPKVVLKRFGLHDIYLVVEPPLVNSSIYGEETSYHELLIYYLHEAFKNLTPSGRLALAAVMVGGYMKDTVEGMMRGGHFADAQTALESALIDVYLLASKFNVANSTIAVKGLSVKVKVIPYAGLVWIGPIVMALSAVYSAVLSLAGRRD